MKASTIQNKLKNILYSCGVILFWVALWQFFFILVNQEILIASPAQVSKRLFELIQTREFWLTAGRSLWNITEGYAIGLIAGTILAITTSFLPFAYKLFHPLIGIIKATPVASFIILALVWIPSGGIPSFISFLMVLPIIWANISEGIHNTPKELLEVAKVYRFGAVKTATKIYVPSIMPFFLAGCTTSLGLAWKAGIAAEVLSTPKGSIGTELHNSKIYIETADLFAWTIVVIILSIALEKLLVWTLGKIHRDKRK